MVWLCSSTHTQEYFEAIYNYYHSLQHYHLHHHHHLIQKIHVITSTGLTSHNSSGSSSSNLVKITSSSTSTSTSTFLSRVTMSHPCKILFSPLSNAFFLMHPAYHYSGSVCSFFINMILSAAAATRFYSISICSLSRCSYYADLMIFSGISGLSSLQQHLCSYLN